CRIMAERPDAFLHQGAPAVQPPSTVSTVPVTNELASEARWSVTSTCTTSRRRAAAVGDEDPRLLHELRGDGIQHEPCPGPEREELPLPDGGLGLHVVVAPAPVCNAT